MTIIDLTILMNSKVYTYTCIACILKQATQPGNADASRDMNFTKSKKKVIKMLITLCTVFTLCW
jgi:hypothetical protein